jgi:hypothetical protein
MPLQGGTPHRATDGQYGIVQENSSPSAKIVLELMEKLEKSAAIELNALGELDEEEFSDARRDIKRILMQKLGNATARSAPAIRRGGNGWHGFVADNFHIVQDELKQLPENEGICSINGVRVMFIAEC